MPIQSLVPLENRTLATLRRLTLAQWQSVSDALDDGGIEAWKRLGFRAQVEKALREFVAEAWAIGEADAEKVLDWGSHRRGVKPLGPDSEGIVAKQAKPISLVHREAWEPEYGDWLGAELAAKRPLALGLAEVPPAEGLAWYQDYMLALAGVAEQELLDKAKGIVARSASLGLTARETRTELYGLFESFPRYRLNNIVRTESSHILNTSSLTRYTKDPLVSGYRYLVTVDDRTTEICLSYTDRVVPAAELSDVPPLHFQAIPDGERVITLRGNVPIEGTRVGDWVLTHKGGFRRITQVVRREYEGEVVTVRVSSGGEAQLRPDEYGVATNVSRFTPEHPLLAVVNEKEAWRHAGDLKVGDTVLRFWPRTVAVRDTQVMRVRVVSADCSDYSGGVNDLSVDEHESFALTSGLMAHNCRTVLEPMFSFEDFTSSDMTGLEPMKGFGTPFPKGTGLPGVKPFVMPSVAVPKPPTIQPGEGVKEVMTGRFYAQARAIKGTFGSLELQEKLLVTSRQLKQDLIAESIKAGQGTGWTAERVREWMRWPLAKRADAEFQSVLADRIAHLMTAQEIQAVKGELINRLEKRKLLRFGKKMAALKSEAYAAMFRVPMRHLQEALDRELAILFTGKWRGGAHFSVAVQRSRSLRSPRTLARNIIRTDLASLHHEFGHFLFDVTENKFDRPRQRWIKSKAFYDARGLKKPVRGPGYSRETDDLISPYAGRIYRQGRGLEYPSEYSGIMHSGMGMDWLEDRAREELLSMTKDRGMYQLMVETWAE